MAGLIPLWWLTFFTALGLCLGSFLNAVIYRLPRNRSLRNPLWSACPHCHYRIAWYDNLPLISFVLLRGRCRHCGVPIATRYVVIEAVMAIVVLMIIDAFFISQSRAGLTGSRFGLTDQLAVDWPILTAHIILFACLLSMSAIDLEHYWVDIRFTNLATIAGFVLHTLWTPRHAQEWVRPMDTTAVVAVLALLGLAVTWIVSICHRSLDEPVEETEVDTSFSPLPPIAAPRRPPPSLAPPSRAGGWLAAVLLAALFFALWVDASEHVALRHTGRALLPLAFFFALIVHESTQTRPADYSIAHAIDSERFAARRMVLSELVLLLPALAGGVIGYLVMTRTQVAPTIGQALHVEVNFPGVAMMRHWAPLYGFATAASGFIIAGAIGWAVRIGFTLLFGKEAFGTGDIHLMAATGCVVGWPVVLLGFILTCGIALVGWIATLPFKRSRALPLGPWLSLAFLTVVLFYDSMLQWSVVARAIAGARLLFLENSQSLRIEFIP